MWITLVCESETWTLKAAGCFEMCVWRRRIWISWRDIRNGNVLRRQGEERRLYYNMKTEWDRIYSKGGD